MNYLSHSNYLNRSNNFIGNGGIKTRENTRCISINSISVEASQSLSQKEVTMLFNEIVRSWNWEGKKLGRLELIRDGQWVHVYSYEKPSIKIVSLLDQK